MEEPVVDIIMATYNGAKYVSEQIESIQRQSYKNWRLLISDDCSSDATLDIVRSYTKSDDRIKLISNEVKFGGAMPNFLNALSKSESSLFMFCDQDDIWLEDKIKISVECITSLENKFGTDKPIFVSSDMKIVDDDLNLLSSSFINYERFGTKDSSLGHALIENNVWGCTIIGNASLRIWLSRCASYDGLIMHDWLVNLICKSAGFSYFINESTSLYRQHTGQEVGSHKFSFFKLVSGFSLQNSRSFWNTVRKNAEAFLNNYQDYLPAESTEIIKGFIDMFELNPINRIICAYKYGYLPSGFSRRLGQMIVFLLTPSSVFKDV